MQEPHETQSRIPFGNEQVDTILKRKLVLGPTEVLSNGTAVMVRKLGETNPISQPKQDPKPQPKPKPKPKSESA